MKHCSLLTTDMLRIRARKDHCNSIDPQDEALSILIESLFMQSARYQVGSVTCDTLLRVLCSPGLCSLIEERFCCSIIQLCCLSLRGEINNASSCFGIPRCVSPRTTHRLRAIGPHGCCQMANLEPEGSAVSASYASHKLQPLSPDATLRTQVDSIRICSSSIMHASSFSKHAQLASMTLAMRFCSTASATWSVALHAALGVLQNFTHPGHVMPAEHAH